MSELELVFTDLFAFIEELIKDYGEPVEPTNEQIEVLKRQIIERPQNFDNHIPKQFFLIERVAGEILFSHNVDHFLGLKGDFDLMQFHSYIDDGTGDWTYLKDYLNWGKAAYMFFARFGKIYEIHKFAFKVRLPMRLVDGRIYWILQESRPLEIDANRNMLSHINTYTLGELYKEQKQVNLNIEIHYNNLYRDDWNQLLAESRYAIHPFNINPTQHQILSHYRENPNATTISCADELKYPRNTIKKYISDCRSKTGIIDRAKVAYPHTNLHCIKEVVCFLDKIGWFDQDSRNGYKIKEQLMN